jgi:hypothetical protein
VLKAESRKLKANGRTPRTAKAGAPREPLHFDFRLLAFGFRLFSWPRFRQWAKSAKNEA